MHVNRFSAKVFCAAFLLLISLSCSGKKNDPEAKKEMAAAQNQGSEPLLPVVTDKSENLLFSFLNEQGKIQAVSSREEVPESIRERVLVVDLSKTPEQRQAHRFAFFVDLSVSDNEDKYPVTVVSRYNAAKGEQAPVALSPVPEGTVVVYSAEWCGYCKKAMRWMEERQIPYMERDIEKVPGAQQEMREKLTAAGVQGGGVPVIDWGGTLVMGFDQRKLAELHKKAQETQGATQP